MPRICSDDGYCMVIKGRAGIEIYDNDQTGYLVNSEMVVSDLYDIAVYRPDITRLDSEAEISLLKQQALIAKVIELCAKGEIKIRLFD